MDTTDKLQCRGTRLLDTRYMSKCIVQPHMVIRTAGKAWGTHGASVMLWADRISKTVFIHKRKEGHGVGKALKWIRSCFLYVSHPGLLDFPVVDWTLVHTAQFLMVPDCPYGFGVLHIGRLWDDIESKNWVLVISLQLWLIHGVHWLIEDPGMPEIVTVSHSVNVLCCAKQIKQTPCVSSRSSQ